MPLSYKWQKVINSKSYHTVDEIHKDLPAGAPTAWNTVWSDAAPVAEASGDIAAVACSHKVYPEIWNFHGCSDQDLEKSVPPAVRPMIKLIVHHNSLFLDLEVWRWPGNQETDWKV